MAERSDPRRPTEPGLTLHISRRARRVLAGHEQLLTFCELVRDWVEQGSLQNARLSFMRLCDALEAHFTVEDQRGRFGSEYGKRNSSRL